jgi:hypothetical protein
MDVSVRNRSLQPFKCSVCRADSSSPRLRLPQDADTVANFPRTNHYRRSDCPQGKVEWRTASDVSLKGAALSDNDARDCDTSTSDGHKTQETFPSLRSPTRGLARRFAYNRPWRPVGPGDVEAPTLAREAAHRWK